MANTRVYSKSFSGGEMSPDMFGRIDDTKYQSGAATMRNFIALPQGPVDNRPGTAFVRAVKDSTRKTRLIPFVYSTDQTMVLEFGHLYIRFHTNGATLLASTREKLVNTTFATDISSWSDESDNGGSILYSSQESGSLKLYNPTNPSAVSIAAAQQSFTVVDGATYTATVDAVGYNTTATYTEKLTNPTFDGNITGWTAYAYSPGIVSYYSGIGTARVYSYFNYAPYQSYISQTVNLDSGTKYILSVDLHSGQYRFLLLKPDGTIAVDSSTMQADYSSEYTANTTGAYTVKLIVESQSDTYISSISVLSETSQYLSPETSGTYFTLAIGTTAGDDDLVSNTNLGTVTGSFTADYDGTAYLTLTCTQEGKEVYVKSASVMAANEPNIPYEVETPYGEDDLFDLTYVQSADVLTIAHQSYAPRELRRLGAENWQLKAISFTPEIAAPTGVVVAKATGTETKYTYTYAVTSVASDNVSESTRSASGSATGNLFESGGTMSITFNRVTGAARYNVYKLQGGLYGYIGQVPDPGTGTTASMIDDNIAPNMSKTPPEYESVFGSTGNYPGAVSYFEQRRCFAGTVNDPQTIWMTRSGTESAMAYSLPIRDDDRIKFRVAAREANTIRHIVPLSQLLLLTAAAEWRVTSVNSDAITPTTISVRPQSYIGSSKVQPWIVNNSLVYCAARGGHVRELGYSWQAQGFITGDLSLRSAHLFDGNEIQDMAFAKAPNQILWFISDNGRLLGLTYIPDQQIGAWHWHDTRGTYESCCVVSEGDEDVLYVVVKRTIDGSDVRYVERFQSRAIDTLEKSWFVDCGLSYDGLNTSDITVTVSGGTTWGSGETLTITASDDLFAYPGVTDVGDAIVLINNGDKYRLSIIAVSSTTVATAKIDKTLPVSLRNTATDSYSIARDSLSGLDHLEGETVSILGDGAVFPQKVVTDGVVTLERACSDIIVGLPYQSDLKTLPLAINIDGFGQGRQKNVNKVWIRVYKSSGIFVGPDEDNLVEAKQRSVEPYGSPPAMKTDDIQIVLTPSWAAHGQVFVRQDDPLPLTIVGATYEVAIGG